MAELHISGRKAGSRNGKQEGQRNFQEGQIQVLNYVRGQQCLEDTAGIYHLLSGPSRMPFFFFF